MPNNHTFLPLLSVAFVPMDGIASKRKFSSFEEANAALSAYDLHFWDHGGERIHLFADWGAGRRLFFIFPLPDDEGKITDTFLQDLLQDILEDRLGLPPDSLKDSQLEAWAMTPEILLQPSSSPDASLYRILLESGEGFDHQRFHRKKERHRAIRMGLLEKYPGLSGFLSSIEAFQDFLSDVPNRTHFYKDFLMLQARENLAVGLRAILLGRPKQAAQADDRLFRLQSIASSDMVLADERFTYFGMLLYHLFPLDRLELTRKLEPVTDEQAGAFRQRARAVRMAFPQAASSSDAITFYSFYAKSLDSVLLLSEETRSHTQVSLLTAKALRRSGYKKRQIQELLQQYDPLAIFSDTYAPGITDLLYASRRLHLLHAEQAEA